MCILAFLCVYMYACMYVYMYAYIHVLMCICTTVYMMYVCVNVVDVHVRLYTGMSHLCMYMYMSVSMSR